MKVAAIFPYDPTSPARVRSRSVLHLLRRIGEVTVYFAGADDQAACALEALGVSVRSCPDSFVRRFLRVAGACFSLRSISFAFYRAPVIDTNELDNFDVIYVERIRLKNKPTKGTFVFDIVDNFHEQTKLLSRTGPIWQRLAYLYDHLVIKRDMQSAMNGADIVLCTTDKEAGSLMKSGLKASAIFPFLHGSQTDKHSGEADDSDAGEVSGVAVFHGRSSYPPNRFAAKYIKCTLMRELPGWHFCIFGEGWAAESNDRLQQFGFQADLNLLAKCSVAVFPLLHVVGVQNKVIEALSYGLPVLLTPEVMAGIPSELAAAVSHRIFVRQITEFSEFLGSRGIKLRRSELAAREFCNHYHATVTRHEDALLTNMVSAVRRQVRFDNEVCGEINE